MNKPFVYAVGNSFLVLIVSSIKHWLGLVIYGLLMGFMIDQLIKEKKR